MLLLSFATRLAFTIGSGALVVHGSQISMDSFVLAYKHLEIAFPVDEKYKEIVYQFRYYQRAILEMNSELKKISFEFTAATESQQKQRKDNFDTIHFFITEWKIERILHLFEKLQEYSKLREGERHNVLYYGSHYYLLDRLMLNWNGVPKKDKTWFYEFNPLSLFVLKNFAANLIKRILREKKSSKEAALYFEEYPHIEFELNRILAELNGYLKENRQKIFEKEHDNLVKNELLLHYEDTIKLNWLRKEGFISLKTEIVPKIREWKQTFEKCTDTKSDDNLVNCDVGKIMEEIKENRKAFESLFMVHNSLTLFNEFENFKMEDEKDRKNLFDWEDRKGHVLRKMDELIEKVPKCIEEIEKIAREEHIINSMFNQFVKIVLGIPENEYKKATISVGKCAKLLELVGENVAHKIDENVEAKAFDDIFDNIFVEVIKINQHANLEKFIQNVRKRLKVQNNKVQFLMLLLSFATRLAFTIGSEALENHGFSIQMDSFVFVYKYLEDKFPISEEYKEQEYKFRYNQASILRMKDEGNAENITVLFDFTMLADEKQERRKENFDIIHYYAKERSKESVKSFVNKLSFVSYREFFEDTYKGVFRKFFHLLTMIRNKSLSPQYYMLDVESYEKEKIYAMKNFAANLAKRILRMKEHNAEAKRYFEKEDKKAVEHQLISYVNELEKHLHENRNEVYESPYLFENEMLMHYEDAIQIDWRTKEDITTEIRALYANWDKIIQKCIIVFQFVTNCNLDQIEKEMKDKENKVLFESFYLDGIIREILSELIICKEHKQNIPQNSYSGKNVKEIITNWKSKDDSNEFVQLKQKMEEGIKTYDTMF